MDLYSSAHAFLIDSGNSVQRVEQGLLLIGSLFQKQKKKK